MNPSPASRRRFLWTVPPLLALLGLLGWLLGPGAADPDSPPAGIAAGGSSSSSAPSASPAPGSAPSSGPTGSPSPGSLAEVPVDEVTPEPAVPLTATTEPRRGLSLRIAKVEDVKGVARGVGEIAGPAVRLTLELANRTGSEVSVDSAVVDLVAGRDRTPAATLTGPGGRAFEGTVAPGETATGVYVFGVPAGARDRVRVSVSYQSGAPVAVFAGDVA